MGWFPPTGSPLTSTFDSVVDADDVVLGSDVVHFRRLFRIVDPTAVDDELELVAAAPKRDRKLPPFPVIRRIHLDRFPSGERSGKLDLFSAVRPNEGHRGTHGSGTKYESPRL
jgi:hypothetical protein